MHLIVVHDSLCIYGFLFFLLFKFINRLCYNQPNPVIMTMMVMMMLVMLLTCSASRNFTLHNSNCSSKNIPNYSANAAVGVVV